MTRQPLLAKRPDGSIGLVDERGQAVPATQRIVITAGDMERALILHAQMGIATGHQLGRQDMAKVAASYAQAGADAGLKAGATAGVNAGARYAMARLRPEVERDAPKRKPMGSGR